MEASVINLFFHRDNRTYILAAIVISLISWCLLKYFYPYPNLTFDSYYYIEAAISNSNVSTWPIGYSKFIRLISLFTHSGNTLALVQFFLLQSSLLLFFLTLKHFFLFANFSSITLFIFLFLNPLFLFGSNHIMSDIVFTSLSIFWVNQLIWMLLKPNPIIILTHVFLLLIIFSIRYSALYYPLISGGVLLISKFSWKLKIIGILIIISLLSIFVQFTKHNMEIVTGARQFSYTGGWKIANNALYMYEHVYSQTKDLIPPKFKLLDSLTKNYYIQPHPKYDLLTNMDPTQGSWYTSYYASPLRQFMLINNGIDPATTDFKKLALFGPYYNEYGNFLIQKYPIEYLKHVVIPNIMTYLFPILEIYDRDNIAFTLIKVKFSSIVKKWFNLTTISAPKKLIKFRATILSPYGFIFTIIHIIFLINLIAFFSLKFYTNINKANLTVIITITTICVLNFLFIILIAPSVLRFQLTVFVLEFANSLIIINIFLSLSNLRKIESHEKSKLIENT